MNPTEGATFYVRRFRWTVYDFDVTHPDYYKKVVARFDRTRIVSVIPMKITGTDIGVNILKCTCQYFERKRKKCRHMYVITNCGPSKNDLDAKYLKSYEAFYGEKEEFTEYFDGLLERRLDGPPINLDDPDVFNNSRKKLEKGWFDVALPGQLPILCPGMVHGNVSELNQQHQELQLHSAGASNKKFDKNVYVSIQPKVVSIANMVETEEEYEILSKGLNVVQQQLLKKKAEQDGNIRLQERGSIVSLPAFDTRKKDKRIKPLMSPPKKQKKHK
jgi:hypothetical protein